MDKEKFDYYWKIALLVVLILGTIYMFWEFKQINKQGIECHSNPFEYGVKEAEKQGLVCVYNCLEESANSLMNQKIDISNLSFP
jgi:hypothetical protein